MGRACLVEVAPSTVHDILNELLEFYPVGPGGMTVAESHMICERI